MYVYKYMWNNYVYLQYEKTSLIPDLNRKLVPSGTNGSTVFHSSSVVVSWLEIGFSSFKLP